MLQQTGNERYARRTPSLERSAEREAEQLRHPEDPVRSEEVRRGEVRLLAQVRMRISGEQPEEDLGDDPPTDRPQALPVVLELGLLQDVEPERRVPRELG